MDPYKETFETWNKVASQYEDKFMKLDLYNETYDFICNSITGDRANILEIACGPGNITKYLLSKRPGFNICGIDIAPNMIELAKRNNPTADFRVMDCRQIDMLKTQFDGIIAGFCLPYLSGSETAKLIFDSYSLLTDHGLIYLSFVEGDPNNSGFKVSSTGDRAYFYFHHLETIKNDLEVSGFEELNMVKITYRRSVSEEELHTIITARKKLNN